jgi:hypothetical protein
LEEWLFDWKQSQSASSFGFVSGIFVYFIWWAKNSAIFQNIVLILELVAGLISKMASDFKNKLKKIKVRNLVMPKVKDGIPWGFFDGACQGHPSFCGVGVIIYISKEHFFKILCSRSCDTNMKAEFSAMWTLMYYANMLDLRKMQVFRTPR